MEAKNGTIARSYRIDREMSDMIYERIYNAETEDGKTIGYLIDSSVACEAARETLNEYVESCGSGDEDEFNAVLSDYVVAITEAAFKFGMKDGMRFKKYLDSEVI